MTAAWNYALANPQLLAAVVASVFALIVGTLTFTGVMLTNRAATNRTRMELAHAAEQARLERLMSARQEAYLEAAEALAATQTKTADLANLDPTQATASHLLSDLQGAITKLVLLSEEETAMAAREALGQYAKALLEALPLWAAQGGPRGSLQTLSRFYASTQAEMERIMSSLRALDEAADPDESARERLLASHARENDLARHYASQMQSAQQEISEHQARFRESVLKWTFANAPLMDDLICRLRRDLELSTDADKFQQQTARMLEEARSAYGSLLSSLQEQSSRNT